MLNFLISIFLTLFLYKEELPPQCVGVITTEGLFFVQENTPAIKVLDSSIFGYPSHPSMCWDDENKRFLIAAIDKVFAVYVNPSMVINAFVEITPTYPHNAMYTDIEIDEDGNIWLLDTLNNCLRKLDLNYSVAAPCFVDVAHRSKAFDVIYSETSTEFIVAELDQVIQTPGGEDIIISYLDNTISVEVMHKSVFLCEVKEDDKVVRVVTSPDLYVDMNWSLNCSKVLYSPQDIEWSQQKNRLLVLAEYGVTSCAFPEVHGSNHIVSLAVAQIVGHKTHKLFTNRQGSGIMGENGDIAIVQ